MPRRLARKPASPPPDSQAPEILVLAGPNGAGKSSIAGEMLRRTGGVYFNPDEDARVTRLKNPSLSAAQANVEAWNRGLDMLKLAIEQRAHYAFETTLGGKTIAAALARATRAGIRVSIWYAALATPELHIERVRQRVKRGGHDIPESDIRRRYDSSRLNLAELLPLTWHTKVFDNTAVAEVTAGSIPKPRLLLEWREGKLVSMVPPLQMPGWAEPLAAAALSVDTT